MVLYNSHVTGNFELSLNIHSVYPVRLVLYSTNSNLNVVDVPANTSDIVTVNLDVVNNNLQFLTYIQNGSSSYVYYIDNISLIIL